MRKTKIVCTLGPATDNDKVLENLMKNGMDVARCNFSHGTHEDHKRRMDKIKEIRKKCDKPVAILLDTKGPEIRTGDFENGLVHVVAGQTFTLIQDKIFVGNNEKAAITFPELYQDIEVGLSVV